MEGSIMPESEDFLIDGLFFKCTCEAFPEQYDVYDENKNQVGYVRYRGGYLSCRVPDYSGDIVFEADPSDGGLDGIFDDDKQRIYFLEKCAESIKNHLHRK